MNPQDRSQKPGAACPSRRTFLGMLGSAGAVRLTPNLHRLASSNFHAGPVVLCVGAMGPGDAGALHTVLVEGHKCEHLASISSECPVALARHPVLPIIYAANGVNRYRHEPRGTAEAFLVDVRSGRLQRIAHQPLSLSATQPRSLAVSPDGRSLLVAAFQGGVYNVLPLDGSGVPGAPSTILKQVGRGSGLPEQATAHPAWVVFDQHTALGIAADFGADRLDILSPDQNEPQRLTVAHRIAGRPGSGPCALALHRNGLLVAAQRLRPALTVFRSDDAGHFERTGEFTLESAPAVVTFHPRHDVLYTAADQGAGRLYTWQLDAAAGALRQAADIRLPASEVRAIHAEPAALYLASLRGLITTTLDPSTGMPVATKLTESLRGAVSLAAISRG